ncbi:MAG: FAD-dependent oxidoreductase [Coriobacteriales bacterium]|jgi:2,4-dienoyl-CoA reductase-like NADH-dependent reductase (Old Yellow Enzyme family)/thioredoxin reductase|nr:FAD-dependent oxidoreductase [Coriobacteriales bacterium]
MEKKTSDLTRRSFLGLGAAAAVGAAAAAAGCTPTAGSGGSGSGSTAGGAGGSAAASGDLIATAYLNPQDFSYKDATSECANIFSPFKLGSLELSHRLVKSAAGSATYLAGPTDEMFEYYLNFAKGGIEWIWMESVGWMGPASPNAFTGMVEGGTDEAMAWGKKLVEECAKYGCHFGIQWGAFAMTPIAELTKEEIIAQEEAGVTCAKWYQEMGFKGIEIHMTGSGLANSLNSRLYNTRTDEYGAGSLENRGRFVCETIQKIKEACGQDFIIEALFECVTEDDNVTHNVGEAFMWKDQDITKAHNHAKTIEEGIGLAKLFEAAGLDCIQCRIGLPYYHPAQFASDLYFIVNGVEGANAFGVQWDFKRHFQGKLIGNTSGAGQLLDVAAMYKAALSIPVGTVTYMDPARAPGFFDQAIADGKADYYCMTRPLTVDTEYVNKLREGRVDEIAPCTRCLHCHIGSNEANREQGYCRVNALTQRVMTGLPGTPDSYELTPAAAPKKVMVIGGGPGGMEAARIAAARGHNVTLYEKTGALGGKLDFFVRVKGKHQNIDDFKAYLIKQLELNGVTVELNKEVDAAFISSEAPDAVVLAVGGDYDVETGAISGANIVEFASFESAEVGENVVIVGGNAQAWDCALWMTLRGKNVHIVTERTNDDLDSQQSQHEMRMMTSTLYSLGTKAWPSSTIKSVADGKAVLASDVVGADVEIPCDTIIVGAELKPNKSLLDGFSGESYAIGDCNEPYNIAKAVIAGNDAGRAL